MYRGQTGSTETYLRQLDADKAVWERERGAPVEPSYRAVPRYPTNEVQDIRDAQARVHADFVATQGEVEEEGAA